MTVEVVEQRRWSLAESDAQTLAQTCSDIVNWRKEPFFYKPGRTAWHRLHDPLQVSAAGRDIVIHALKIKGVGHRDYSDALHKPSSAPFDRKEPHIGYSESGDLTRKFSTPSPLGGLTMSKAETEFFTSERLVSRGVAAQVPLFLYKLGGRTFRTDSGAVEKLGIVVTGLPSYSYHRLSTVFYKRGTLPDDDLVLDWGDALGLPRPGDDNGAWRMEVLERVSGQLGKLTRGFHEAGYYRHSGSLGNFGFCEDRAECFLLDLDSTQPQINIAPHVRRMEEMRDVASLIYHVIGRLTNRSNIGAIAPAGGTEPWILGTLSGYFGEGQVEVTQDIAVRMSKVYRDIHARAEALHATETPQDKGLIKKTYGFAEARHLAGKKYWIDLETDMASLLEILTDRILA